MSILNFMQEVLLYEIKNEELSDYSFFSSLSPNSEIDYKPLIEYYKERKVYYIQNNWIPFHFDFFLLLDYFTWLFSGETLYYNQVIQFSIFLFLLYICKYLHLLFHS